jgi:Sap, sulfolipid-1-addressing protein
MGRHLLEIVLLGLASALWPLLIAFVVLALRARRPAPLLLGFFLGGILTTVCIGTAIVLSLHDTVVTSSKHGTSAAVELVVAALLYLGGTVLLRPPKAKARPKKARKGPSTTDRWTQRAVDHGIAGAFFVGIVLNIVPGVVPFVALTEIAQLNLHAPGSFALVTLFYLVMFLAVELPLLGILLAPAHTQRWVAAFNAWLDRNVRRVCAYAAFAVATVLVARAIFTLVTG